jgi:hypothetical protein
MMFTIDEKLTSAFNHSLNPNQGTLFLLEALRRSNLTHSAKFFNAGSRLLANNFVGAVENPSLHKLTN